MESYTVVRPEHLNQYGHLFGGCLLKISVPLIVA